LLSLQFEEPLIAVTIITAIAASAVRAIIPSLLARRPDLYRHFVGSPNWMQPSSITASPYSDH
jgi:hypothetical protein